MSEPAASGKICVVCGQDCAGKPRVKDPQGRYSCKSCHELGFRKTTRPAAVGAGVAKAAAGAKVGAGAGAAKPAAKVAQSAAPVPLAGHEPEPEGAFDGFDNAAILAGLESSPATAVPAAEQCPGCGAPMASGAMVCMSCGFNKASGRASTVKVTAEGGGAGAIAETAAKVLWQANPLAWLAAACVGGAIGTAAWYYIAIETGKEIRFVALGIGVLVGLCVKVVSGSYSGAVSGGIAVAVALASIVAGRYMVFNAVVKEVEQELGIAMTLDDEQLIDYVARDVAARKESMGTELAWPPDVEPDSASGRWDFPPGVWEEAEKQWKAAAPAWKSEYKAEKEADLKGEYESNVTGGFLLTFVHKSTMWILAALGAALWVGSGGDVAGAVPRKE